VAPAGAAAAMVVGEKGSKVTTAVASKVGESVSMLPSGGTGDGDPSADGGRAAQSPQEGARARKRLSSEGYVCPCRACPYFGIMHKAVHALVGYGKRKIGKRNDIQRWRCQRCRTTFSCRRGTLLYYLKSDP